MKIGHDLAEKKFVPGRGRGWGWGWVGLVFSKFKEWSKPFKNLTMKYIFSGYFSMALNKALFSDGSLDDCADIC